MIGFSIVPPEVPFLISKFVFKRLGAVLDSDSNEFFLPQAFQQWPKSSVEMSYDLMSGRVAVEFVPKGRSPPVMSEEIIELAMGGHEVMVNDPELKKTHQLAINDHRTHVIQSPSLCKPTVTLISLQTSQTIQITVGHHLKIQVMKNKSVPLRQRQVKVQVKLRLKLRKK